MDSLELIINIIIIALLVPTIIYAYSLNKNLSILRQNQDSLAKLVAALNDATFKAENSIPKLKSVTEHSSEGLKEVVDNAKELKDDLLFINERADNLADRLEHVISGSRGMKDEQEAKSGNAFSSPLSSLKTRPQIKEDTSFRSLDERSEAEMELLKALRSIK